MVAQAGIEPATQGFSGVQILPLFLTSNIAVLLVIFLFVFVFYSDFL